MALTTAAATASTSYPSGGSAAPSGSAALSPAIQIIWSKEILFEAMPTLRFEQFAVKKTELGVQPGLQINFMRYSNLTQSDSTLYEGVDMSVDSLSAQQFSITVAEQGKGVAMTELLLNASFDDTMASASRLLGRHMARAMDTQARDTLLGTANVLFGYQPNTSTITGVSPYDKGTKAASRLNLNGNYLFTPSAVKDGVEYLASRDIPRLGETYVCFIHPHQSRSLRDQPQWIEVTKYAAPGNFMLGEIGRLDDVVFIETTQVKKIDNGYSTGVDVYQALMIGDNAFGHAVSLPVELRDNGIKDFGRRHELAWYSIWGFGRITANAIVAIETN